MQGVHVLLGRVHAGKNVAQIDQHGLALLDRPQEFDPVEFAYEIFEERVDLVLRGALGAFRHREWQRARGRELEPFIAHQQHRLRQIERGKTRVDRKGDDAVGERDLVVLQPGALPAEHDAGSSAASDMGGHFPRRALRRHHGFGLVMRAGGGGKQQIEVGHRRRNRIEQLGAVEDVIGAGGGALGGDVGPAVARLDDPQARECKIAHGARRHADVLAELRLDQNHNGAFEVVAGLGLVGARSGHHFTFWFSLWRY